MAKYRKKPVVVEAVQWFTGVEHDAVCTGPCGLNDYLEGIPTAPHLHTMHKFQTVYLEDGDWILPERDGKHFYPCKPDIFEATYELVEEDD